MKKQKFRFNKNIKYATGNKNYIYLLDKKIYICSYYYTYIFEYIKNKLFLKDIVHLTNNFVLNYLVNKSLEKSFPNLEFKLFLSFKQIYCDVYTFHFELIKKIKIEQDGVHYIISKNLYVRNLEEYFKEQ